MKDHPMNGLFKLENSRCFGLPIHIRLCVSYAYYWYFCLVPQGREMLTFIGLVLVFYVLATFKSIQVLTLIVTL